MQWGREVTSETSWGRWEKAERYHKHRKAIAKQVGQGHPEALLCSACQSTEKYLPFSKMEILFSKRNIAQVSSGSVKDSLVNPQNVVSYQQHFPNGQIDKIILLVTGIFKRAAGICWHPHHRRSVDSWASAWALQLPNKFPAGRPV